MIGFENELRRRKPHENEGPDTKDLDKKEVFDMVDYTWVIAPYGSRGIHRDYLVAVHLGQVFRITHHDLKHFELDLTPEMVKRTGLLATGCL